MKRSLAPAVDPVLVCSLLEESPHDRDVSTPRGKVQHAAFRHAEFRSLGGRRFLLKRQEGPDRAVVHLLLSYVDVSMSTPFLIRVFIFSRSAFVTA